jgi:hypothetical protein
VEVRGGGRELRRRWKGAVVDLALHAPMASGRSGQGKTGSARFRLPSRGTDGWGYRRTSTSPSRLAGAASCQFGACAQRVGVVLAWGPTAATCTNESVDWAHKPGQGGSANALWRSGAPSHSVKGSLISSNNKKLN